MQVDLNHIQTVPQLFNSQLVPATTYHAIELVLDGSNAGTVVPTCLENPSSLLEGCIASQISLSNPSQFLTTLSTEGISVPLNGLATMVININPVTLPAQFPGRPGFSGGLYQFSASISISPTPPSTPNPLGLVTGAAFGASKVAAELSSTGQVVETTTIGGGNTSCRCPRVRTEHSNHRVELGPGFAYAFAHNVLVRRGKVQTVQLDAAPAGQIALTGKVTDACSGMSLQGATVEVVAPAAGSTSDCTQVPTPLDCVVLASANTDDTGTYPMPPSNFVLQSFSRVPNGKYTMVVTDAGYDTVASSMSVNGGAACSLGTGGLCNFAMGRLTIEGLVTISPPVPSPRALNVLVTARRPRHPSDRERRAGHGADRIDYGAVHYVRARPGQRGLARYVRDGQRLLQRIAEKASGQSIGVLSALASASRCGTALPHPILSMQCAGHGIDHGFDYSVRRRYLDRAVQKWSAVDVDRRRPTRRYGTGPIFAMRAGRPDGLPVAALRGDSTVQRTDAGGHSGCAADGAAAASRAAL